MRALLILALGAAGCGGSSAVDGDGARMLIVPPEVAACDPTAAAPARLTLVTWNIRSALSSSVAAIADELAGFAPDVVLLQEVDFGVARSGRVDEPDQLAAALGLTASFAEALPWDGGHYGLALLSRLPFVSIDRLALDEPAQSEPRIALDTRLCAGPTELRVVDAHADNVPAAGAAYAQQLMAAVTPDRGRGLVVAGDFNALPSDPGPSAFIAAGLQDLAASRDPTPTWPEGGRREDFVFADAPLAAAVTSLRVVDSDRSDHRPIVVTLTGPL